MGGILLALMSSAAWGLSDFVGGVVSRSRPAAVVLTVSWAFALAALTVVVVAFAGPPPSAADLSPGVLGGLGTGLGVLALYRALAIGPMSVVAPLFSLGAVVPVIVGFASGDRPGWLQGVGMVAAVVGCFLAARAPDGGGGPVRREGIVMALLAACGLGVGLVGLDAAADADPLWGLEVSRAVGFLAVAAVAVATRGPLLRREIRPLWPLPAIGLLDVSANTSFAFASTLGMLSVVSVLASVYPVVTVLLARAVLGERMSGTQGVGVVAAFGGVGLLVAG